MVTGATGYRRVKPSRCRQVCTCRSVARSVQFVGAVFEQARDRFLGAAVERDRANARLRLDFVVEGVGDAFLSLRVADVPGAELELPAVVGDVVGDFGRADLVPVIGTVIAPDKNAGDTHLSLGSGLSGLAVDGDRRIGSGSPVIGPASSFLVRVGADRLELRVCA